MEMFFTIHVYIKRQIPNLFASLYKTLTCRFLENKKKKIILCSTWKNTNRSLKEFFFLLFNFLLLVPYIFLDKILVVIKFQTWICENHKTMQFIVRLCSLGTSCQNLLHWTLHRYTNAFEETNLVPSHFPLCIIPIV